jgi:hypothetical protein
VPGRATARLLLGRHRGRPPTDPPAHWTPSGGRIAQARPGLSWPAHWAG